MLNDMYQAQPNLIAETYRNTNLHMPRRIEKHFDFVEVSDDGLFLLGTSNLSGRIWSGSIWVFEKYPGIPNIENCLAGIEFGSSVASGLWLDNDKRLIIGCDSGSLHQLSLNLINNASNYFTIHGIATEHDDGVTSLSLMKNNSKIVSGSMDMNIKVWDAETLVSEKSYCPAHAHMVTSVSSQCENGDLFVSTSLDGTALVWDTRLEKPASLILRNECGYTASAWLDDKFVCAGSNDGSVSLVDLRLKKEIETKHCAKRPIFKVKFNKNSEYLAVCADDPFVRVFKCADKKLTNVYQNEDHTDFVRGLSWDKSSNILYSCGWDSKIMPHKVFNQDNGNVNESENDKKEEK